MSSGCIKGRRCLIPLFNCVVKIKQREAGEKCCAQANAEGSVRRRSLKKGTGTGAKHRNQAARGRKNKTRPNEGERTEEEGLRKRAGKKEG